ncbi:dual oxidase maturation factor 1-like isoform X2 [Saccostrea echinata]|uniref:dual oxidase maturation factor 1-like isoform X2 n=1 Tax=Saccostrea echinata TaxID=191078 RepID=UPI002A828A56|nr:dual oxidase maturation factor 1-like isoform X2 [Saccostrea echinata]
MSSPGLFDALRSNGAPTYYDSDKTPFMADILESGLIYAFVILAFSFFIILPGIRGKERIFVFIRVTVTLFIGGVIMLTNFGYEWEVAEAKNVRTKYKAGSAGEITADIAVYMGLRGINVTLKAEGENRGPFNETINYNEHFDWRWEQGRIGFGIFAGRFQQEFRSAQFRGTPLPVIWIAEYFIFDGEGIRWGRHYRQAGWYAHIMMWLALPLWILTIVLFFILLKYGAYFLMLTGGVMVIANILWATIRNVNELLIPFSAEHKLEFHFGPSFYLNLITGLLCIVLGVVIWILDLRFPELVTNFFGVDPLQDDNFIQGESFDTIEKKNGMEMSPVDNGKPNGSPHVNHRPPRTSEAAAAEDDDDDDDEIYEPPVFEPPPAPKAAKFEKRRSRGLTQRLQRPRRRPPPPVPDDNDPEDLYSNTRNPDQVHINMGYRH